MQSLLAQNRRIEFFVVITMILFFSFACCHCAGKKGGGTHEISQWPGAEIGFLGAESFISSSFRPKACPSARGGRMMRKARARLAHKFVRETFDAFGQVLGVSLTSLWL